MALMNQNKQSTLTVATNLNLNLELTMKKSIIALTASIALSGCSSDETGPIEQVPDGIEVVTAEIADGSMAYDAEYFELELEGEVGALEIIKSKEGWRNHEVYFYDNEYRFNEAQYGLKWHNTKATEYVDIFSYYFDQDAMSEYVEIGLVPRKFEMQFKENYEGEMVLTKISRAIEDTLKLTVSHGLEGIDYYTVTYYQETIQPDGSQAIAGIEQVYMSANVQNGEVIATNQWNNWQHCMYEAPGYEHIPDLEIAGRFVPEEGHCQWYLDNEHSEGGDENVDNWWKFKEYFDYDFDHYIKDVLYIKDTLN
ncbi:hypothetical protein AB4562_06790 [Vibrio sp. 10N.222.54.A1]|uniref:hypothetical protein n=1 Tax=unclassified Vibrio TaxID=2614977 RepID=UPI00354F49C4